MKRILSLGLSAFLLAANLDLAPALKLNGSYAPAPLLLAFASQALALDSPIALCPNNSSVARAHVIHNLQPSVEGKSQFRVGYGLEHPRYGWGTVEIVKKLDDCIDVTVKFAKDGVRKLKEKYLPPETRFSREGIPQLQEIPAKSNRRSILRKTESALERISSEELREVPSIFLRIPKKATLWLEPRLRMMPRGNRVMAYRQISGKSAQAVINDLHKNHKFHMDSDTYRNIEERKYDDIRGPSLWPVLAEEIGCPDPFLIIAGVPETEALDLPLDGRDSLEMIRLAFGLTFRDLAKRLGFQKRIIDRWWDKGPEGVTPREIVKALRGEIPLAKIQRQVDLAWNSRMSPSDGHHHEPQPERGHWVISDRQGIGKVRVYENGKIKAATLVSVRFENSSSMISIPWSELRPLLSGREIASRIAKTLGLTFEAARKLVDEDVPYDFQTESTYWYDEGAIPEIISRVRAFPAVWRIGELKIDPHYGVGSVQKTSRAAIRKGLISMRFEDGQTREVSMISLRGLILFNQLAIANGLNTNTLKLVLRINGINPAIGPRSDLTNAKLYDGRLRATLPRLLEDHQFREPYMAKPEIVAQAGLLMYDPHVSKTPLTHTVQGKRPAVTFLGSGA